MRRVKAAVFGGMLLALVAAPSASAGGGGGVRCLQEEPEIQAGWVWVLDMCFSPAATSVETGDALRWKTEGIAEHTVTFADGPDLRIPNGDEGVIRFNRAGDYSYVCSFHPGMNGSVTVDGNPTGSAPFEVLDPATGEVAEAFGVVEPAAARPENLVVELDPLAAAVLVLLFLPLTVGATMRLAGFNGPGDRTSRIRLQLPWRREPVPSSGTRR